MCLCLLHHATRSGTRACPRSCSTPTATSCWQPTTRGGSSSSSCCSAWRLTRRMSGTGARAPCCPLPPLRPPLPAAPHPRRSSRAALAGGQTSNPRLLLLLLAARRPRSRRRQTSGALLGTRALRWRALSRRCARCGGHGCLAWLGDATADCRELLDAALEHCCSTGRHVHAGAACRCWLPSHGRVHTRGARCCSCCQSSRCRHQLRKKRQRHNVSLWRRSPAYPSLPALQPGALQVKGILNKLTPEKFERLLSQLIPLVNSYDVLQARAAWQWVVGTCRWMLCRLDGDQQQPHVMRRDTLSLRLRQHPTPHLTALCPPHQPWLQGTIHQVFENAVQQPTFVAMYADLCRELDAALPEVHAPGARRLPQGCCLLSLCSVLPPGCLLQVCGLDVALPRMHKCKQLHPMAEAALNRLRSPCLLPRAPPSSAALQARTGPPASRRCWPTRARRSTRPPRRRARCGGAAQQSAPHATPESRSAT